MEGILTIGIVVCIAVLPVMFSAKFSKAKNTGFWICFFAVIVASILGDFSSSFVSNELLAGVVSIAATGVVFSQMLGAKFIQSVVIAVLAYGIRLVTVNILVGAGIETQLMHV